MQGIRTIYLLLAFMLLAALYAVPSIVMYFPDGDLHVTALKSEFASRFSETMQMNVFVFSFGVGVSLLTITIAVFLRKNLPLQNRFIRMATVFSALIYAIVGYYLLRLVQIPKAEFDWLHSPGIVFPLLSCIVLVLAGSVRPKN